MISWLRRLVHGTRYESDESSEESFDQAVLIRIFADTLLDNGGAIVDLATLEDQISELLGDECDVDGHDIGNHDATIFIYAPSAASAFEVIRPFLVANPLTNRALVILRSGPPGYPEREFQLPNDR